MIDTNRWSLELLQRLDWRRFQDLVMTMFSRGGFLTERERLDEDGSCLLTLRRGGRRQNRPEALVFLAGWDAYTVDEDTFADFEAALERSEQERGVVITPGSFTGGYRHLVDQKRFELVDGSVVLETLLDLPRADQEWLLTVITSGDFTVPTCPHCQIKMQWRESECPPHQGPLPDLPFAVKASIRRTLRAGTVAIGSEAEVNFFKPVYAQRLVVEGTCHGHFIVDGPVTIGPAGVVNGLIAARSIKVETGGRVDGDAVIMGAGALRPVKPLPFDPVWGCPSYPECPTVFDPRPGSVD